MLSDIIQIWVELLIFAVAGLQVDTNFIYFFWSSVILLFMIRKSNEHINTSKYHVLQKTLSIVERK